ncbi:MAG: bifunctional methionine sulfoxide reductase B/A protein [Campylobacterota bacterium]|nr:bifunctional methionine sulfoxide reductase B/A protein [Campylobacterota bacterium]
MKSIYITLLLLLPLWTDAEIVKPWTQALEKLSAEEKHVVVDKGTERPFSGKYVNTDNKGIYRCKVCNAALYKSVDKFKSDCGWPSFDDAIPGAVTQQKDADGRRTEIVCARCGAHLGHIFKGEGLTAKNRRYCVNSLSLNFDKEKAVAASQYKRAYFAGGCFWGVEYYLEKLDGVKEVASGFMGGSVEHPSYRKVISSETGHLETVEVLYDPGKISYEALAKIFFEIHDPTQKGRQGPDIGEQYSSAIFVDSDKEQETVERLIAILKAKGYKVVTKVLPKKPFYKAETYHQNYYEQNGKQPYCHTYIKRF